LKPATAIKTHLEAISPEVPEIAGDLRDSLTKHDALVIDGKTTTIYYDYCNKCFRISEEYLWKNQVLLDTNCLNISDEDLWKYNPNPKAPGYLPYFMLQYAIMREPALHEVRVQSDLGAECFAFYFYTLLISGIKLSDYRKLQIVRRFHKDLADHKFDGDKHLFRTSEGRYNISKHLSAIISLAAIKGWQTFYAFTDARERDQYVVGQTMPIDIDTVASSGQDGEPHFETIQGKRRRVYRRNGKLYYKGKLDDETTEIEIRPNGDLVASRKLPRGIGLYSLPGCSSNDPYDLNIAGNNYLKNQRASENAHRQATYAAQKYLEYFENSR
jgi:hypothetical protein